MVLQSSWSEPFPTWLGCAELQCVDCFGEAACFPGAAAELVEDVPGLELGVCPFAKGAERRAPVVGSSSRTMSGSLISDLAMVSRRRIPPDSASTGLSAFSLSWAKSSNSALRSRIAVRLVPK
jgi:hypothetical protein